MAVPREPLARRCASAPLRWKNWPAAADQHRDGMLEHRALQRRIDLLSLARQQLGLCADDVRLRRHADAIAVLGDLQRLLLGRHDVVQNDLQLILGAQLEIVGGELGLRGQPRAARAAALACAEARAAFGRAADLAPDIDLPVSRESQRCSSVWRGGARPVRRCDSRP